MLETRRIVTVLFSDVVGSTALGEQLDPETLRAVMDTYFDRMQQVVEHHGGTVEKFIGDAIMAVFGLPVLHEDDAARACGAALAMRAALAELNEGFGRNLGITLLARTGIMTGEVVTGDRRAGQRLAIGDALNTAARLEQAAAPGEILLGAPTQRLVRDLVNAEPVEPVAAKGKAEPVRAFRLMGLAAGGRRQASRRRSPIVGRDRQLRLLADAFEAVMADRSCHLFTVLGTAGVGKSRLVEEFVATVEARAQVLRGRCLSYGEGITFWPLAELVAGALGVSVDSVGADVGDRLARRLHGRDDGRLVAQRVAGLLGARAGDGGPDQFPWAVRRLLEILAEQAPLVVVLDDLHWGETTFLDVVEHVADWTRDAPILLACMARPELLELRPGWAGGKLNATSVLLEPLGEDDGGRMVASLLGPPVVPVGLGRQVARAAEGNPLFVEELLSVLVEDNLLVRQDDGWALAGDLAAAASPTVQAVLAARLDRLPPDQRMVLGHAAVEGQVFHLGALEASFPSAERAQVTTLLTMLVRKDLVRPDHPEVAGQKAFRFRHQLIRDTAYTALPKEARADLHERFAGWLESSATVGEARERDEILGYHLERAHRYRTELRQGGARAQPLAQRAGERLGTAGLTAVGRGDYPAAGSLLARAAALLPAGHPQRLEVLTELGFVQGEIGQLAQAQQTLAAAAAAASAAADERAECRALVRELGVRLYADAEAPLDQKRQLADDLAGRLERLNDPAGAARAMFIGGVIAGGLGQSAHAARLLQRCAEQAAQAGDGNQERMALSRMFYHVLAGPAPAGQAAATIRRYLHQHSDPLLEALAANCLGPLEAMAGRFETARELAERSWNVLRSLGMQMEADAATYNNALVERIAGDLQAAQRWLRTGYENLKRVGDTSYLSTRAAELARVLCDLGCFGEADQFIEISRAATVPDDLASLMGWRCAAARVLAHRGQHDQAARLAREAMRLAKRTDWWQFTAEVATDVALALEAAGRRGEARAAAQQAASLFERKNNRVSAGRAQTLLAHLASPQPA